MSDKVASSSDMEEKVEIQTKRCSRCRKEKPYSEFYGDKTKPNGLSYECKECKTAGAPQFAFKNVDYPTRWCLETLRTHRDDGFDVKLTQTELMEKVLRSIKEPRCPICGTEMRWKDSEVGKPVYNTPSLDRINNEKGMTAKNTWIICFLCNQTKGSRTMREFVNYCIIVVKRDGAHIFSYKPPFRTDEGRY